MFKKIAVALVAAAGLLAATAPAHAGGRVSLSIGLGVPIGGDYAYGPPPVYYEPPPAYYAPPPVYYSPPPVVYAPAPRYYSPPVIYRPAPVYYGGRGWGDGRGDGRGYGYGHGHGHGPRWHDDDRDGRRDRGEWR